MDSEKALLSQILQSKGKVYHDLQPREWWFTDSQNRRVFNQIEKVIESGGETDIIAVGQLGSPSYVSELSDYVQSSANAKYHAGICSGKGSKAELTRACRQAAESTDDTDEIIEQLSSVIEKVVSGQDEYKIQTADNMTMKLIDKLEERYKNRGTIPGIESGFQKLDSTIMGFQKRKLYVIGSRPAQGKSALMVNIATHVSAEKRVGILMLEDSWENFLTREVASLAKIDSLKLASGFLNATDFANINNVIEQLHDRGIYVYDKPSSTLNEVITTARRMVNQYKCEILFVDYLQLIQSKAESDRERVMKASIRLKDLARELNVPIVALAQLRRDSDGRRPTLGDFQHSSQLEQDANVAMLLYHRVVDLAGKSLHKAKIEDESQEHLEIYLLVDKNRDGRTAAIPLEFDDNYVTFRESRLDK